MELEKNLALLEKNRGELISLKATLDSQKAHKTTLIENYLIQCNVTKQSENRNYKRVTELS